MVISHLCSVKHMPRSWSSYSSDELRKYSRVVGGGEVALYFLPLSASVGGAKKGRLKF